MTMTRFIARLLCTAALSASAVALAQGTYPVKPIRIIVGFASGGNGDIIPRLVGQKLSEQWGQQVVIENRPGSNGNIAAELVAKAVPDGYTLLSSDTTIFAINPHLYSKLSFDPFRDFTPLAQMILPPIYVVVNASLPIASIRDLINYAKANPGKLSYASAGNGSIHHLSTEFFKMQTGIDMVHIPYKGSGQSAPALVAGDVHVGFIGLTSVTMGIKAGRLRAIGYGSATRSSLNPDIPAIAETVPGFDVSSPFGFVGPAGVPRDIIDKVGAAVMAAVRSPDVRQKMNGLGLEPVEGTGEVYGASMRRDYERFGKVVREIGLKID